MKSEVRKERPAATDKEGLMIRRDKWHDTDLYGQVTKLNKMSWKGLDYSGYKRIVGGIENVGVETMLSICHFVIKNYVVWLNFWMSLLSYITPFYVAQFIHSIPALGWTILIHTWLDRSCTRLVEESNLQAVCTRGPYIQENNMNNLRGKNSIITTGTKYHI